MPLAKPGRRRPGAGLAAAWTSRHYYGFEEDAVHFHRTCRDALAPFGDDNTRASRRWCDEYFSTNTATKQRAASAVFFDDFAELGLSRARLCVMQAGGRCLLSAYLPIAERPATPYGERERDFQLHRRGRYVEFNLVWDRGTYALWPAVGRAHRIHHDVHAAAREVVYLRRRPKVRPEAPADPALSAAVTGAIGLVNSSGAPRQ